MRYLALILFIFITACSSIEKQNGSCQIYTYLKRENAYILGHIRLGKAEEKTLLNKLPSQYSNMDICWYTSNGNIIGEIDVTNASGKSFTFTFHNNEWILEKSEKTLRIPAHN